MSCCQRQPGILQMFAFALWEVSFVAGMLSLLSAPACGMVPSSLSLSPNGSVSLRVNGSRWLNGGPTSFCSDGSCFMSDAADPHLRLWAVGARSSSGIDVHGAYQSSTISWATVANGKRRFETQLRSYSPSLYVLAQQWLEGCSNCSGGVLDRDDVQSAFPTFIHSAETPKLNFLSWGGNQLTDSTTGRWDLRAASALRAAGAPYPPIQQYSTGCNYTYQTKCPLSYPYFNGSWVGGAEHGQPLVLYDEALVTVVVSPLRNFLVAENTISRRLVADGLMAWATGVNGLVRELPAGFVHESVMVVGNGVSRTMKRWGDVLLAAGGKRRPNSDSSTNDKTLATLGYWSDRGSYYYGRPDGRHKGWSMEQTLKAVQAEHLSRKIPVRYYQLDDWWFKQAAGGDFGGMQSWKPCESLVNGTLQPVCSVPTAHDSDPPVDVFPSKQLGFLGAPLALYMGLISNSTVYADQYQFLKDERFSMPPPRSSFFADLFANTSNSGSDVQMILFEQDFLSYWFAPGKGPSKLTQEDASLGHQFLLQQALAASAVGAHVQYCMNLPSTVLSSTQFDAVTQAREAKDHTRDPLGYSWKAGLSGLLLYSLGLGSSIDNIFTGADEPGCNGGFNCTEPSPEYEMILAALSGGPVAIGDGLGYSNRTLIMSCCIEDGRILRVDRQLTVLDGALRLSFEEAAELDVWGASSVISGRRWGYILSTYLEQSSQLTLQDMGLDADGQGYVAWDKASSLDEGRYSNFRRVQRGSQLSLRACPATANPRQKQFVYTLLVPVVCLGCPVFLGEVDKVVTASSIRFKSVNVAHSSVAVSGYGAEGEVLTLGIANSTSGAIVNTVVTVGPTKEFTVNLML